MTSITELRSASGRLFAGMWRPLASVITPFYYVAIIFASLYARIQSSGIILIPYATFVPNFVSFTASIAELARGEKSRTKSITQSLTQLI